ncbi:Verru_Chthon cassette protein C [Roseimicrobium sp. ORNL1]|uniref:Verru_Chthon cassette protein C n=1 Tax=Roseimicrobium sp. ORNL1 TaxID=2711231 RepID=UPI0013E18E63|nr:Verru_Chthon cassette protein C [Roseimicrobium sp. ORNL1]QIF05812.1 Verru_Chthon cassette protein C [Roseimicrobium sp. ORNL1]
MNPPSLHHAERVRRRHSASLGAGAAFTLLEIMISTAIVSVLMLVCVSALDQTQKTWKFSQAKVEQYREARLAFEAITRNLSQATLNTYWDYYYQETGTNEPPQDSTVQPGAYVRFSELQFRSGQASNLLGSGATPSDNPGHVVFFQAPLGLSQQYRELGTLLNARGYYVQFGSDVKDRPPFLAEKGVPEKLRYRLMEYRPPAERPSLSLQGNAVYAKPDTWYQQDRADVSEPLADNIILLLVSPRVSEAMAETANRSATWIAPSYRYNSLDCDNSTITPEKVQILSDGTAVQGTQHLLPPQVQITLVALDEPSAQRFAEQSANRSVDILGEAGAPFAIAADYDRDLSRLKDYLNGRRLNYRVFTSSVTMRSARWDSRQ